MALKRAALHLNSASEPRSEAGEADTDAASCVEHENREANTGYLSESTAESRIAYRI